MIFKHRMSNMPNKHSEKKSWKAPKQKYKISNGRDYNQLLCQHGNINIWLSQDAIDSWHEAHDAIALGYDNGHLLVIRNFHG